MLEAILIDLFTQDKVNQAAGVNIGTMTYSARADKDIGEHTRLCYHEAAVRPT